MREIKFRVWDKKLEVMYINVLPIITELKISGIYKGYCFLPINDDRSIFMQYTGLHDTDSKEIYEVDILILDGGGKTCFGSVGCERGCFTFNASWLNKEEKYMPELYRYTFFAELEKGKLFKDCIVVEVISNIHENPELIKE